MRPERSSIVLLALLMANAVAILFFRFFISMDGPIHVLHASLLEAPWATADHLAHGITYNRASHGFVGDRVLMVLLLFLSPVKAHAVFAALVCCALVLSVVAYLRAHGTRMGLAILWIIPITFNLLLIMGLFHFLLGTAVAFGSVAWWKWKADSPQARWTGLLVGAVFAWYTHRGSLPLLGALFLLTIIAGPRSARTASAMVGRRSLAWRIVMFTALGAAGIIGMLRIGPLVRKVTDAIPGGLPGFKTSALLQPLFLLDRPEEAWPVLGIGLLLALSFATGIRARWRMGRKVFWHDALLGMLLSLMLIAWFYGTPTGHKVFIAERSQWIALLALALWLAALADAHRGWTARIIGGAALCALPMHLARLVQTKQACSRLLSVYMDAMEACDALAAGSLVLPVMADPDPLLQHLEAYVAICHDGILFAPGEHVTLVLPTEMRRHASWLYSEDPFKFVRHWRKGLPPEIDQVLFMGRGIEQTVERHPWPSLLGAGYRLSFDNGNARIYTAIRGSAPSAEREGSAP